MSFDQLGLRVELIKAVESKGYTAPTPIQSKAVPVILAGRDILARAQTGTGKTDAYALPLVDILGGGSGKGKNPKALVLTPTRELALQVGETIKAYARRLSLRCTVVHGGVNINPQITKLKRGVDILVATPGRLLDLTFQRHLNLSGIEFLVFDEADRMLDLGFSEEISGILELIPDKRRTMLFSATYSNQIQNLAKKILIDPEHVEVTPNNAAADSVTHKVHMVDRSNKQSLLIHLIKRENRKRILIFTRTKHGANKLTEKLAARGLVTAALHSNKSQSFRTRTLTEFKNGKIPILVATDVAARGLDITNLPYVINYDIPTTPEAYIHRIGRTGRAGEKGVAISFVTQDDKAHLKDIEKHLNKKIPSEKVEGFTEESDVPDFVLFRPDSPSSNNKADKELKELVTSRNNLKQQTKSRKSKSKKSGKKISSGSLSGKPGTKKRGDKNKSSYPGSRPLKSSKQNRSRSKVR